MRGNTLTWLILGALALLLYASRHQLRDVAREASVGARDAFGAPLVPGIVDEGPGLPGFGVGYDIDLGATDPGLQFEAGPGHLAINDPGEFATHRWLDPTNGNGNGFGVRLGGASIEDHNPWLGFTTNPELDPHRWQLS